MQSDPRPDPPAAPRPPDEDPLDRLNARTEGPGSLGSAGKYAGLGFQFVGAILLFLWVGKWVDRQVGTDGPFLLLGVFGGAGAAFYSMYRSLMADQARDEAETARKRAASAKAREER